MTLVGDDGDHAAVRGVVPALSLSDAAGEVVAKLVSAGAHAAHHVQGRTKPWVQFCVTQFCQVPQVR